MFLNANTLHKILQYCELEQDIEFYQNNYNSVPSHQGFSLKLWDERQAFYFKYARPFIKFCCFEPVGRTCWKLCVFLPQVLLVLFTVIRKKFWDYGRLALVADNEGWVSNFFPRSYG